MERERKQVPQTIFQHRDTEEMYEIKIKNICIPERVCLKNI